MSKQVRSRAVFYIGGFDPKSSQAFYETLEREAGRFSQLWETNVRFGAKETHNDVTICEITSSGEEWNTRTDFNFLTLDDIVLKDFNQPFFKRLTRSLLTSADYLLTGTAFAFARHAWRFFLYFLYPVLMPLLTLAFSLWIGWLVAGSALPMAPLAGIAVFFLSITLIIHWVWKRWFVLHLMDLWSFSRDFVYRSRRDIETKLDRFAELIVTKALSHEFDEIILVGHSTGGALILDTAGRVLEKSSEIAKRHGFFNVLTVGSTALKIGLHPKAGWFRERVGTLVQEPNVTWVEYQCLTDLINFFGTDPAALMGTKAGNETSDITNPITGIVKIRHMVSAETHRRIRRNFFRVHYQFVFGNTKKYHYDFMAICLGPARLRNRALNQQHYSEHLLPPRTDQED